VKQLGPYYPHRFQHDYRLTFTASFLVLETMLQYAHDPEDAWKINRRLIALWNAAEDYL
jgi:hypothetical protein